MDKIFRTLNIKPEEKKPVLYMLLLSLSFGLFTSFYFSIANAAFLKVYGREALPLAFILTGFTGMTALTLFGAAQKRTAFHRLLPFTIMILGVIVFFYRFGLWAAPGHNWIAFVMFLSISPMWTLLDLTFWAVSDKLFDLQQGKRLNALISSGQAVSAILGFAVTPLLLIKLSDANTLLLLASGALGLATLMLLNIFRTFPNLKKGELRPRKKGPGELAMLLKNRYLLLIAMIAGVSISSKYFIDFNFYTEIKNQYQDSATIASFIAVFFGGIRVVELVLKLFVSGRLLGLFGLLTGLCILPVSLVICSSLALLTAMAHVSLTSFFVLIAMTKFFQMVFQRAFHDPNFKVLYQPLDKDQRFALQTTIEGKVRQASQVLSGLSLLVIVQFPSIGSGYIVFFLILLLILWIVITIRVYQKYRGLLLKVLEARPRERMANPMELMIEKLIHASHRSIHFSLRVLDNLEPTLERRFLMMLLDNHNPKVRRIALHHIGKLHLQEAREKVEAMIDDPDHRVARQAKRALREIDREFEVPSTKDLEALVNSNKKNDRVTAALTISHSSDRGYEGWLYRLMLDKEPMVHRAAILAAGRQKHPDFIPHLLEQLSSPRYSQFAAIALADIGEPVFRESNFTNRRWQKNLTTTKRVLRLMRRIGGAKAFTLMAENMTDINRDISLLAIRELAYAEYRATDVQVALVKHLLQKTCARMAWYLAVIRDIGHHPGLATLKKGLDGEFEKDFSSLFHLLGLINEPYPIRIIAENVDGTNEQRAYALEIAQRIVPPELKEHIMPFLERLGPQQTLNHLRWIYPQKALKREACLRDIVTQGRDKVNLWLRACALDAMHKHGDVSDELISCLFSHHPLISETAAWTLFRLDAERFKQELERLPHQKRNKLDASVRSGHNFMDVKAHLLMIQKIRYLENIIGFSAIPQDAIAEIIHDVREAWYNADEVIMRQGEIAGSICVIVKGRVKITEDGVVLHHEHPGSVVGEIGALGMGWRTATVQAVEPTHVLTVSRDVILSLMADHLEFIPQIIDIISERSVALQDRRRMLSLSLTQSVRF